MTLSNDELMTTTDTLRIFWYTRQAPHLSSTIPSVARPNDPVIFRLFCDPSSVPSSLSPSLMFPCYFTVHFVVDSIYSFSFVCTIYRLQDHSDSTLHYRFTLPSRLFCLLPVA